MGGRLRVALIGSVALNSYLLAKFLRRIGVEADSFDTGGGTAMWVPWWEDAKFDPESTGPTFWQWTKIAAETGFRRPPWAKIVGNDAARPWYDDQESFEADLPALMPGYQRSTKPRMIHSREVIAALHESRLTRAEQKLIRNEAVNLLSWRSIRAIADAYDLTVFLGPLAGYACMLPAARPYVTFEHATMRAVPRRTTPDQELLAVAYQHADWNIITNADCIEAAEMLGIRERSSFIPHPLDEDKFSPGDAPFGDAIKAAYGSELLFYAPARSSFNEVSGTKRNERLIYAFARYVNEAEPAGSPRATLILSAWGEHYREVEALCETLGIHDRCKWVTCLPKLKVLDLYRACDIVFDQFSETVGSFGTVTAETMACAKPVVTHVNPDVHRWCLDELPPVCNALRVGEIYDWMVRLAGDPELRARKGVEGRAWIEKYHGWRRVAEMHRDLYERVLSEHRGQQETRELVEVA